MSHAEGRRVLVVEDDAAIRELLHLHLGLAGFTVEDVANGREALDVARTQKFDLLVLDVMLPGLDGVSICRAVRTAGVNTSTPILILTARDSEADIVIGLDSGADDYLTKPFGVRELQARVTALMRRLQPEEAGTSTAASTVLRLAPEVTMDIERRQVLVAGAPVDLTRQEFDLLHQLVARRGVERRCLRHRAHGGHGGQPTAQEARRRPAPARADPHGLGRRLQVRRRGVGRRPLSGGRNASRARSRAAGQSRLFASAGRHLCIDLPDHQRAPATTT
jgi:DNA-binding response OmpR family regulator